MTILPAHSLESTSLYLRLQELVDERTCPDDLPGNLVRLCREAAQRLKLFPAIHGQYTLHDEIHCLRVVQLMAAVCGSELQRLNAIEVALLILSAYFHDQGMIVDATELSKIKESDDWKLHEQNWIADHPNFNEAISKLSDPLLAVSEKSRVVELLDEFRAAMFTDFIRKTHGERSAEYIRDYYFADPRLVINDRSVVDLLALICVSHVQYAETITPENGYLYDALCGTTKVNVAFVAYVLRLADILDFDRERTPDSLYRAIHFTSAVSLQEWEKHRSITGWEIGKTRILFAAECKHPAYERAIREFLTWVDHELGAFKSWAWSLPAEYQHLRLDLPEHVDRSRVGPLVDPVTRNPLYRYFDLEFTLARDEIVKLLMTDKLYSEASLFIRELLQNSLDALRYRSALYHSSGIDVPDLHVKFEHFQDAGVDVVRCTDNGVGMDERVITGFLTRAGRSYYRSPEFEHERARFRQNGCDFDPCAKFGIGFLSCFMFGDDITVHTRRDFGIGREHGPPLIVDVKGLSGIIVIRPGVQGQPVGTVVEVRGRRKSFVFDEPSDFVHLVGIIEAYALAVEFPIAVHCDVPVIKRQVTLVPEFRGTYHPIDEMEISGKSEFNIDLASIDDRLTGELRLCTLVDTSGAPCVTNSEACISVRRGEYGYPERIATLAGGEVVNLDDLEPARPVCCDGILVAGNPGTRAQAEYLHYPSCELSYGDASFAVDTRGDLKPFLTPARTPPFLTTPSDHPSWANLDRIVGRAYRRLLDEVVQKCSESGEPDRIWAVAEAYSLDLRFLHLSTAWNLLQFPFQRKKGRIKWLKAESIASLRLTLPSDIKIDLQPVCGDGSVPKFPSAVTAVRPGGYASERVLLRLLMGMSAIQMSTSTELKLILREPDPDDALVDFVKMSRYQEHWQFRTGGNLAEVICALGPHGFSNRSHPIVVQSSSTAHKEWDELDPFGRFVRLLATGEVGDRFDSVAEAGSNTAHLRTLVGGLYSTIDWGAVHESLHPPYSVFRPGIGIDQMTRDDLQSWASGRV